MSCIRARDIMYPRVSIPAKMKGDEVVRKLTCPYPALPVINDDFEVVGIVSEYDLLSAVREGRTTHEFSAESIMSCGHADHGVCSKPVTVPADAPIEEISSLLFSDSFTVLPVVQDKMLVGLITRKSVINAMAEQGYWHETDFQKRTP